MPRQINVPDVKVDWQYIRRVLYTALCVWTVAVRGFKIDPFGLAAMIPIAWFMDLCVIVVLWLVFWHLWHLRPRVNTSN